MRYHFFLHYGWFFQNLGKEAVRTFMHTTVIQNFQTSTIPQTSSLLRTFLAASYSKMALTKT